MFGTQCVSPNYGYSPYNLEFTGHEQSMKHFMPYKGISSKTTGGAATTRTLPAHKRFPALSPTLPTVAGETLLSTSATEKCDSFDY